MPERDEGATTPPMTDDCQRVLPLLHRLTDGEASPEEAMRSARHLSDCTTCRIQLARERRLAAMLEEGLVDPLPVGEDFVRDVMANLPQGPQPAPDRKRRRRRMLRLAGLVGLLTLAPLVAGAPAVGRVARRGFSLLPELDVPLADGLAAGAMRLGSLLMLALDRLASGMPLVGEFGLGLVVPVLTLALLGVATACGSAGALALAMGGLLRTPPQSRSA